MPNRPAACIALLFLCLCASAGAARAGELPLAGAAVITSNSPRTAMITTLLEDNFARVLESTGAFKTVNPALLREELQKHGCVDEQCILGFAADAGMGLFIRCDFDDATDFIILRMTAYGLGIPYQRQTVYTRAVRIPMKGKFGAAEYNAITEEHAAQFVSKLMAGYRSPVGITRGSDGKFRADRIISGTHDIYRSNGTGSMRSFSRTGSAVFKSGTVTSADAPLQDGDFLLSGFGDVPKKMETFFYGRKHEAVFKKPEFKETIYALLLTGPASATMPIISPLLGYYRGNDWQGLALWTFNLAPYLYLELNGMSNYWANYYKKKKTVPRDVQAQYYFGLYMLCAGGASLFTDSFAHTMLKNAADFQGGPQSMLGNSVTAGYLALIAGGAGHFSRGDRLWGYLYYHADNLLLYFMIREFCPEKKFMPLTRTFSTAKINPGRAYSLLAATCAVKIAEVVHAIFARDRIENGELLDEGYTLEPVLYAGDDAGLRLGLQCSYRW
jgi:hypothetical protein